MTIRITKYNKRGNTGWEIDIILTRPNGETIRERRKSPVTSHSGSLAWAREREVFLLCQEGRQPDITPTKRAVPSIKEFFQRFLDTSLTNNKPSTHHAKESMLRVHLVPAFGNMKLDEVGPAEIEGYKAAKLKEGLKKKSINNHLAALGRLLNLAIEWGLIDHAPKSGLFRTEPQGYQFLTFEETPRFLAAVPPEWWTFTLIALKTGLRVGELLALKWEDLDLKTGNLVVRRTLWQDQEHSPKGGRTREVPLSSDAVAALKALRHLKGAYVFCDAAGARLTHSMVKDIVPKACAKAQLAKRLTMHCLRHTFASHLVMKGVALKAVQELLGHATIEMTMRYAHLSPEVKREAVQKLDEALPTGDLVETGN